MRKIEIGTSGICASAVSLGCMRVRGQDELVDAVIKAAWEAGIDFFDHADIYGTGNALPLQSHDSVCRAKR